MGFVRQSRSPNMSLCSAPLFLQLLLLGVVVLLVICASALMRRFYAHNVVVSSTRKLQLRDKGQVAVNEDGFLPCFRCKHILRIGIDDVGVAHLFCHHCEEIFPDSFARDDDDLHDGGGESLPAGTSQPNSPSGPN